MIALSTFLCTIVIHIYHRVSEQCLIVPKFLKFLFFDILGKCYCILPRNFEQSKMLKSEMQRDKSSENLNNFFKFCRQSSIKNGIQKIKNNNDIQSMQLLSGNNDSITEMIIFNEIENLINLENVVKEIGDYLNDTKKKIEFKEKKMKIAKDWKLISLILDRTFFYIFLLVTIITILIISLDVFNKN